MTTLIGHLYRQVMRKGRVIGLSALVATLGLILWLTSLDRSQTSSVENYHATIVAGGTVFSLALLIVTVAVLRDEKDGGTLPFILLRPISRGQFALSAIIAGVLASLTMAVIAWAFTLVGALAAGIPASDAVAGIVLFGVASFGYAAIFVPLGYLVPRALLIGLMYVVLIEGIIAQALESVAHLSIWRIATQVYAAVVDDLPSWITNIYVLPLSASVGGGLIKTAGVGLLGWGVLYWALKNRDAV